MTHTTRGRFLSFPAGLCTLILLAGGCGGGSDPAAEETRQGGTLQGSTAQTSFGSVVESAPTTATVETTTPVGTGECNPQQATCPRNTEFTGQVGGS
ncbi:MAG: hypothetical protein D6795_17575, partial [Deltaproteobacteria bacterium]